MPQRIQLKLKLNTGGISRHGVAMFNDKIVILGGQENIFNELAFSSVVMYDITKKNVRS